MAEVKQISYPNLSKGLEEKDGGIEPEWAAWIRDMTLAINKGYDGTLDVTTPSGTKTLTFEHGILTDIA